MKMDNSGNRFEAKAPKCDRTKVVGGSEATKFHDYASPSANYDMGTYDKGGKKSK